MATLLVLTRAPESHVLPALDLLGHSITRIPAEPSALVTAPATDLILVDATTDLAAARSLCKLLSATGNTTPVMVVVTDGGFSALRSDWGFHDVVAVGAQPAEVDARIRLACSRSSVSTRGTRIRTSGLEIDEENYSIKMHGHPIDLTYKEFELLRFLAGNPSRVFTREQLLHEVWGSDYYGGTRTVDVHVRRLRAKLGDLESLIGTVRNVGYRFTVDERSAENDITATNDVTKTDDTKTEEDADERLAPAVGRPRI